MRQVIALAAVAFLLVPVALAKDAPSYDKGQLLSMNSVPCGTQQSSDKNLASQLIGTDDSHSKTQQLLCQEYTIQTDRLVYHVRPKDAKHPALLPVGEGVELRIHNDKMFLRAPEGDDKEREYQVISIQMRNESAAAKSGQ